jgi:cell division initiation protein
MRLSPLDIRKQEFTRAFRGYEAEEVQAFLSMLSNQWEEVIDDARRKDDKIRDMESKLVHYEKVEEALQEALTMARETSRKALENAEEKARLIVERAETRAEEIKQEAEHERHQIKRETAKLSGRRSEIVTRLRAFLMSEMELLARFEGDDPIGFIKLLPAEEHRLHQITTDLDRLEGSDESRPEESLPVDEEEDVFELGEGQEEEEAEEWPGEYQEEHEEYAFDAGYLETDLPGEEDREGEGVLRGPGWTARSAISRPSEQRQVSPDDEYEEDEETPEDQRTRVSSDEIEKIRRILSDLD